MSATTAAVRAALQQTGLPWWRRLTSPQRTALIILEFGVLLLAWQVAIDVLQLVNPAFLPPPTRVISGLRALLETGELYPHLWLSGYEWGVAYAAASVLGIATGLLIGGWTPFARLGGPILWVIYAAPWIAFQPLFIVWFGFGSTPVIFLVATAAIFPVLFNTAGGVTTVSTALHRCAAVFGAGRLQRYRKIVLPSILPFVLIGLRHAAVTATGALLVGQMTGSTSGLGALMVLKTQQLQTGAAFAVLLLVVVFTTIVAQSLQALARWLAPWHFG